MAFIQSFIVALVAVSFVQVVRSEGGVKGGRSGYYSPAYVPPVVAPYVKPYAAPVAPYVKPYAAPVSPYVAPYNRAYVAPVSPYVAPVSPYVAPVSPYVAPLSPYNRAYGTPYNRAYVAPYTRPYVAPVSPYNRAYVAPAVSPYYDSYNARTTYDNYAARRAPVYDYQSAYHHRSGYVPPVVTSAVYNRYTAAYTRPLDYKQRQIFSGYAGTGVKSISG